MKKFISGFLLGALLMVSGFASAYTLPNLLFSDVTESDWFAPSVASLNSKGVLKGYPNGSFAPANGVNRAEMAATVNRSINYVLAYELLHSMVEWANEQDFPQEVSLDGNKLIDSGPEKGGHHDAVIADAALLYLQTVALSVTSEDISRCQEAFTGKLDLSFCSELGEISTKLTAFTYIE